MHSLFLKLTLVINPLLISLIHNSIKPNCTFKEAAIDAFIITGFSSVVAIIIMMLGIKFFSVLGVSASAVNFSGGLLLMFFGIEELKKCSDTINTYNSNQRDNKSIIIPIVVPACIGGVTIAIILSYVSMLPTFSFHILIKLSFEIVCAYSIIGLSCIVSSSVLIYIPRNIILLMKVISLFIILALGAQTVFTQFPVLLR